MTALIAAVVAGIVAGVTVVATRLVGGFPAALHAGGRWLIRWKGLRSLPRVSIAPVVRDREVFTRLWSELRSDHPAEHTYVLTGLSGVGKTQIVAALADSLRTGHKVFWVDARCRKAIISGYAGALRDAYGVTCHHLPTAAAQFLDKLATEERWAVVLDGLVDPCDLDGLWPPAAGPGWTLVTTRCRDGALAGDGRVVVEVAGFTPEESLRVFDARVPGLASQPWAESTAAALGHLPLAVDGLAMLIATDPRAFDAFHGQPTDGRADREIGRLAAMVSQEWRESARRADGVPPFDMSTPFLELCSLIGDRAGVPEAVFRTRAAAAWFTTGGSGAAYALVRMVMAIDGHPQRRVRLLRRLIEFHNSVAGVGHAYTVALTLHRFGLAHHDLGHPYRPVRLHPLLQRAVRGAMPPERLDHLVRAMADALLEAMGAAATDRQLVCRLQENARALANRFGDVLLTDEGPHPLLAALGRSYGETGQLRRAVRYFRKLAASVESRLGPGHPQTLHLRSELADSEGQAGNPARAAAYFAGLHAGWAMLLGPRESHALTAQHRHAHWLGLAGEHREALDVYEDLLVHERVIFGATHRNTLATRCKIASLTGRTGNASTAVDAFEAVLSDQLATLGDDDRDTLLTRCNLGFWRGVNGEVCEAVVELERVQPDLVRVLGPDHVDALVNRYNLARFKAEAGDDEGARTEFRRLWSKELAVLDPRHPLIGSTLRRMVGLAGHP
jgi:hypothetical protein